MYETVSYTPISYSYIAGQKVWRSGKKAVILLLQTKQQPILLHYENVQPIYKHAWIFAEGLAGVVQNDMVGFINTRGEVVIDFRYPYRGNSLTEFVFKNGHCVVA